MGETKEGQFRREEGDLRLLLGLERVLGLETVNRERLNPPL